MAAFASRRHLTSIPGVPQGDVAVAGKRIIVNSVIRLTLPAGSEDVGLTRVRSVRRAQIHERPARCEENKSKIGVLVARQMNQ